MPGNNLEPWEQIYTVIFCRKVPGLVWPRAASSSHAKPGLTAGVSTGHRLPSKQILHVFSVWEAERGLPRVQNPSGAAGWDLHLHHIFRLKERRHTAERVNGTGQLCLVPETGSDLKAPKEEGSVCICKCVQVSPAVSAYMHIQGEKPPKRITEYPPPDYKEKRCWDLWMNYFQWITVAA